MHIQVMKYISMEQKNKKLLNVDKLQVEANKIKQESMIQNVLINYYLMGILLILLDWIKIYKI